MGKIKRFQNCNFIADRLSMYNDGMSDEEIAKAQFIEVRTVYNWRWRHGLIPKKYTLKLSIQDCETLLLTIMDSIISENNKKTVDSIENRIIKLIDQAEAGKERTQ